MSASETIFDFSQCAAGLADVATLLAEAAQHLSEAARSMSHGLQPELHVPHKPSLDEMTTSECESIKDHDLSGYHSESEDANTGNNVQRPDPHIGRSEDLDSSAIPLAESDQSAPHGERDPSPSHEAPTITKQDEFRDTVLSPGRYYVVLEEEFDILPLITAYASLCRKLSAILPNHAVLEVPNQLSAFSPKPEQYISNNKSSLLIQSFASWRPNRTVSSISDAFVVWGFLNVGEEQLRRIQDAVISTKHTFAIVTAQEYQRSSFKSYLMSLGFTKYPKARLIKELHGAGFLSTFRTIVQGVLHDQKFYGNIRTLYKEFLGFYMSPPSKDVWWSGTRAAQLANNFAARTLLHGRKEDGSSTFQPDGRMLPVDREFIDKFGLQHAAQLGLVLEDTTNSLGSSPLVSNPAVLSKVAEPREDTSALDLDGRWYLILQEDFDALPFILYQAERNQRVVGLVSHGTTAEPYKHILETTTTRTIIRPGHSAHSTTNGVAKFASLDSGLLLARGNQAVWPLLNNFNVEVDVVIFWGVPQELHFTQHMNDLRAKRTFVLLSGIERFTTRQMLNRKGTKEYPGSAQMNSTGPKSLLHSYREQIRRALVNISYKVPKRVHSDQIHQSVKADSHVSARESVIRANQFAARVLLHGEPEDGSPLYPPVGSRPSVGPNQVEKDGLQPYVLEGLVTVWYD